MYSCLSVKRFGIRITIMAMLMLSGLFGAMELKAEKVDRRKLTFRDWGLYCGKLRHVPEAARPKGWNYYDPYFIQNQTPWDFFIIQVNINYTDSSKAEVSNAELHKIIDGLQKQKKLVILRVPLFKRGEKLKSAEIYQKKLDKLFEAVNIDQIYGISLDEENISSGGIPNMLETLYDYVKGKYPGLIVYQFYTPMVTPVKGAKTGFRAVRADGWISDVYCVTGERFEKHVVRHLDLDVTQPTIHIIWASPAWPMGRENRDADKILWWKEFGQTQFDDQLKTCREYNLPVAFFCAQKVNLHQPVYWGWAAPDQRTRNYYTKLSGMAIAADNLPPEQIGFRKLNKEKIDWANTKPSNSNDISLPLPYQWDFAVDYQGNAVVSLSDRLLNLGTKYETLELDLFSGQSKIVTPEKTTGPLRIVSGKKTEKLELIYQINWKVIPKSFTITCTGSAQANGSASLEISKNGKDWTQKNSKGRKIMMKREGKNFIIETSSADFNNSGADERYNFKNNKIWLRLTLKARSGKRVGSLSIALDNIIVRATYPGNVYNKKLNVEAIHTD